MIASLGWRCDGFSESAVSSTAARPTDAGMPFHSSAALEAAILRASLICPWPSSGVPL